MSSYAPIPLTTIRIFQEEQGALAVNLLYDKIYENADITQHISIGHQLIERKSVGKAPLNAMKR
jgi:DNA-binding LacI/PurR family transcriptional regulator